MIRNTTTSTILLAATVTAAVLTQATYVRAATRFDGNWSLVVYTRSGPCDASYRLAGQIVNGAVVYGGGGVQVYGRVRANGAAYLRVSSGSAYAVGSGHLTFDGDARRRQLVRRGLGRPLLGQLGGDAALLSCLA